jgi:hypothetical protein
MPENRRILRGEAEFTQGIPFLAAQPSWANDRLRAIDSDRTRGRSVCSPSIQQKTFPSAGLLGQVDH